MPQQNDLEKLSKKLTDVLQSRSVDGKKYSLYRLSRESGVDYGHVHRIVHGKSLPSKEVLVKICKGLECTEGEMVDIFHAAGYLAPGET